MLAAGESPPRVGRDRHVWHWGLVVALLYTAAAVLTLSPNRPGRILYDGNAPPLPYRWVVPPSDLRQENQLPTSGVASIPLTVAGSGSASISTDDVQVTVVMPEGAIAGRVDESSVQVRITPFDPRSSLSPPSGLRFDGNAYAISAAYSRSREPGVLRKSVTVVLRYPMHATMLLRNTGQEWRSLQANIVPSTLQIFAPTDAWGTFVAAAPTGLRQRSTWASYGAATVGLLGTLFIAWLLRRRVFHASPTGVR